MYCPRYFDPDDASGALSALRLDVDGQEQELPLHRHRKGQLVLALKGAVVCREPRGFWMLPANSAMWIPGGVAHSNRALGETQVYFLFVEPCAVPMPAHCCMLGMTPLAREMVLYLADGRAGEPDSAVRQSFVQVLLDQLSRLPVQSLYCPVSDDGRLQYIARSLLADPRDRSTLPQWAARVAMSERTLARRTRELTGMTFGRWRQQLQLLHAVQRLSVGASVQAVAAELGYESVHAFITMFKGRIGQSPGRFSLDRRMGDAA
ncbi:helix-turn-helix transcriptional regulator [Pseudomonas sp. S 311-6]|nr:helix-turn-helix transcriptional regulator [Pseudomonas sp. S 311-6]